MGDYMVSLELPSIGDPPTLKIDGESIILTDDVIDELLGVLKKRASKAVESPFARASYGQTYYYIDDFGRMDNTTEVGHEMDDKYYSNVNYFQKESIARQVALHQLLNRKLLKFTYDNNCVDTAEWGYGNKHWFIYYDCDEKKYRTGATIIVHQSSTVYFSTKEAAEQAINEVVKPFMKEYPELVW